MKLIRLFRPERWANPPEAARAIPGLFANTLTFLNGNPLNGNRACIGFKFAMFEYVFICIHFIHWCYGGEHSIDSTATSIMK